MNWLASSRMIAVGPDGRRSCSARCGCASCPGQTAELGVQHDAVEGRAADRVADDDVVVAVLQCDGMLRRGVQIVLFITMLLLLPPRMMPFAYALTTVQESMTEFCTALKVIPWPVDAVSILRFRSVTPVI